ncbi:hypothetical protein EV175_005540, partial [Coemansia sp. RSA 1933]
LGEPTLLKGWYTGSSLEEVAKVKRRVLHSESSFSEITMEFNIDLHGIMVLIELVERLRKVLIETYDDDRCGAIEKQKLWINPETNGLEKVVISDPFEKRSVMWEELSPLLLRALEESAQHARGQPELTSSSL